MANLGEESRSNLFVNDGSFMEMFRRLQKQQKSPADVSDQAGGQEDGSDTSNTASSVSEATGSIIQQETECKGVQRAPPLTGEACKEKDKVKGEGKGVEKPPPQIKASQVADFSVFCQSFVCS